MRVYLVFGTDKDRDVKEFLGARFDEAEAIGVCRGPSIHGGNDFILPVEIGEHPKAVDLPYHFDKWPGLYYPFSPLGEARRKEVIDAWFDKPASV